MSHFTKGTGGKDPIERVTGSLAFGALPRIVFAAAKTDESAEGGTPRIIVRAKSNIGPSGGGLGTISTRRRSMNALISSQRIAWLEPLENTAKELLDEAEPQQTGQSKKEMAEQFLKGAIRPGEKRAQAEIEAEAATCVLSERTLRRAEPAAKVKSVQDHGKWWARE